MNSFENAYNHHSSSEIYHTKRPNRILIINETIEVELDVSSDDESERLYIAETSTEEQFEENIQTITIEDDSSNEFSEARNDCETSKNDLNGNTELKNGEIHIELLDKNFIELIQNGNEEVEPNLGILNETIGKNKKTHLPKKQDEIEGKFKKTKPNLLDTPSSVVIELIDDEDIWKKPSKKKLKILKKKKSKHEKNTGDRSSMKLTGRENPVCLEKPDNDVQLNCCPYCSYKMYKTKKGIMVKHLVQHHFLYSDCPHCLFHSHNWKIMESHIRLKHSSLQTPCPYCENNMTVSNLQKHVYHKHFSVISRTCQMCDFKIQKSSKDLMVKMRQHVVECHSSNEMNSSFSCPVCSFQSSIQLEIKSHIYHVHSDVKGGVFNCVYCNVITLGLTELIDHMRKLHQRSKMVFCIYCKFKCSSEFQMSFHGRTHEKRNMFVCPYCRHLCKQQFTLKYHILNCHRNKRSRNNISKKVCMKLPVT